MKLCLLFLGVTFFGGACGGTSAGSPGDDVPPAPSPSSPAHPVVSDSGTSNTPSDAGTRKVDASGSNGGSGSTGDGGASGGAQCIPDAPCHGLTGCTQSWTERADGHKCAWDCTCSNDRLSCQMWCN